MINLLKRHLPKSIRQNLGRALLLKRELPSYLIWRWRMRNDPLFQLSNIDEGLRVRSPSSTRSPDQRTKTAQRIINAYHLASADQMKKSDVYKVSNEWVPIFRQSLQPLLTLLEQRDAVGLRDLLDNFYRSSISVGLIGLAVDMSETFFGQTEPSRYRRTQLLIDQVYRYRLLEKLVPDFSSKELWMEDFGNPYGLFIDGKFVRNGSDYQYYYASRVNQMLSRTSGRAVVAELGGGIGGFANFLSRSRDSDLTYINLDLPEILCISSYQLLNLLPEKKIALYGEIEDINSGVLSTYDLALMPSFVIESLEADSVNVAFNSYSLAEMDAPTIENYASQLSRVCKDTIFHVNHVRDALVGANNFPFDLEKFTLTSKARAEWNVGRNLWCDEYEFIYKRIEQPLS